MIIVRRMLIGLGIRNYFESSSNSEVRARAALTNLKKSKLPNNPYLLSRKILRDCLTPDNKLREDIIALYRGFIHEFLLPEEYPKLIGHLELETMANNYSRSDQILYLIEELDLREGPPVV